MSDSGHHSHQSPLFILGGSWYRVILWLTQQQKYWFSNNDLIHFGSTTPHNCLIVGQLEAIDSVEVGMCNDSFHFVERGSPYRQRCDINGLMCVPNTAFWLCKTVLSELVSIFISFHNSYCSELFLTELSYLCSIHAFSRSEIVSVEAHWEPE